MHLHKKFIPKPHVRLFEVVALLLPHVYAKLMLCDLLTISDINDRIWKYYCHEEKYPNEECGTGEEL